MNTLRRLAVGLIAIGLVLSAVYGTGAFDTLTTQRDATVQVAGDAGGYLALAPADGPNGAYASQQNGQLRVSLAGAFEEGASGSGVNPDAITGVQEVFTITNRGTQPVGVWVTDESDRVTFEAGNGPIEEQKWAVTLGPGESQNVDLVVDTREYTGDDASLLESVTIHADAEAADGDSGGGGSDSGGGGPSVGDTAPETGTETNHPESDGQTAEPPTTAGPPELSPEMKDRMEEVRSEQNEAIDDAEKSDNSGDGVVGTIAGMVGSAVGVNEGTVAKHGGTVLKSGARVISRVAVPITAAYVFFENGVGTAGSPATTHGSLTMVALYPADATGSELNEPLRLPSGAGGYEAPDGTDREFGRDQLVQLPGITHDNVKGAVGEILKDPKEVREEDGYTVVVGDNPQGDGEILLWIYDGFVMKGTTEEMEQSEETEQNQGDTGEDAQQQGDGSSDSSGPSPRRILPEIARLIPDGGEVKEHEAMNELRQKGVPSETVVDWSNQGYDVQTMNKALDQYQNSGETFSTDRRTARGEFGEILAKQEVTNRYPRSAGYEYEQNVKLDKGGRKGEIDWVVIGNDTGNVVATYQVKSGSSVERVRDAQKQQQLVKNNLKEGEVSQIVNMSGLTVGDFTDDGNLDEIDRYTLGPQDGTSSNRQSGNSYDETYDLTEDEFEAVLDMIRENGL